MTQYARVGNANTSGIDEDDGTKAPPDENGYVTLGVDSYLFPIGGAGPAALASCHIVTDDTIAGVFTIETCNAAKVGPGAISDYDTTTVGAWVKEDPDTAYIASVGTGWSITNMTLTKTAGTGGAMLHLGNLGSLRIRLKAVITTGGKVRVMPHMKPA